MNTTSQRQKSSLKTYEEIFTEILEEAEALHSNGYLGDEEVDVSDDGFRLYGQGGYVEVKFDPDNQDYEVEVHNEYFEEDEDELEDETFRQVKVLIIL